MRKGDVYIETTKVGEISESADGAFIFVYDVAYATQPHSKAVSRTLPVRQEPYTSRVLFPFFDGLIPEGWLLDVAVRNWKLKSHDRMGLLLVACGDCIGNVSIHLALEVHS
ncbi:MAG: HipA N-terminal domain-containing protein [Proteobacteria bacterium]|nr:HipA N-terminal domain-containing protein [Pseudomonadota bacterium]